MKVLIYISRIIAGLVFIFSGTVKAIDPLGTVYKFQDYFSAFNLQFLEPFALPAAILLCLAEFLTGISVLFKIRIRYGVWLLMLMMVFFTPLTLVLALTNPVSDCGCFGDAIKMTNWQTFFKNVVILIPAVVLFLKVRSDTSGNAFKEWSITGVLAILFIAFIFFNLRYLPVIDFMPYKKGTYIPEKMEIPEGVEVDRYETTFIYERDGVRKEFTLENYPADDSTWTFVDQKSILVSRGYIPPVHDFIIRSSVTGEDLTDLILSREGFTMLMISQKLGAADHELLNKGYSYGYKCLASGMGFYVLTASGADEIASQNADLEFCLTDEITLKTIVRANPGYMLLRKGTIVGKWSPANLPEFDKLIEMINK
jgi:hypothetical protein